MTAPSQPPGRGGFGTWQSAIDWAGALVHGGHDDWRLPTSLQPDASCSDHFDVGHGPQSFGVVCTGSEMGRLFAVDLGGQPCASVHDLDGDSALRIANRALFTNMAESRYWTATDNLANAAGAWTFSLATGEQWARRQCPNRRACCWRWWRWASRWRGGCRGRGLSRPCRRCSRPGR